MIQIAHCNGSKFDTHLENITFKDLTELVDWLCINRATGDKGSNGYLLRCTGKKRGNDSVDDTAPMLMIDGDSRYTINGTIESGAPHPEAVHECLKHCGINHYIYPSHSCDKSRGFWKYRVLIPVTYHRNQLDALLWRVFQILHREEIMLVDVKENHTWAQAWFKLCFAPDTKIPLDYCYFDGQAVIDIERITAAYEATTKALLAPVIKKAIVTTLSADPIKAFNQTYTIEEILLRNGYKRIGKRYLHPNSSSKVPSVRILEGGAYSDGNDVLNDGRCHDAFDCFRLLECDGDYRTANNWNPEITRANQRAFFEAPETTKPQAFYSNAVYKSVVKSTSNENQITLNS